MCVAQPVALWREPERGDKLQRAGHPERSEVERSDLGRSAAGRGREARVSEEKDAWRASLMMLLLLFLRLVGNVLFF